MDTAVKRLGVLGFAHGHVHPYLEQIRGFADAEAVAGWDDDRNRGRAACERHDIRFEPSPDRLLDEVDAVIVGSPTNRHAEHVVAAAESGTDVLLQKPMALTVADCDQMIAAIERAGIRFSLCYQMRVDPVNLRMKELVDSGAVGNVAIVRRRHAIPALLDPGFAHPDNWHLDPMQNLGMFADDASHAADWLLWMLGPPVSVMAEIDNVVTDIAPDDNGVALYRFGRKEIGVLTNSSTMLAAEATTEIYGDAGVLLQNYGDAPASRLPRPAGATALRLYRAGADNWEDLGMDAHAPHSTRIATLARPMVDFLHGRRGPIATAAEGRSGLRMILAAYRSAAEGVRVRLDDEGGV